MGKQYVWLDGKFVDFDSAKVHLLTHSVQYGSGVFEGIRAYKTSKGPAIFRLKEHVRRFYNSAKIYQMPIRYNEQEIFKAVVDTIKKNKLGDCYVRPYSFYNDQRIGLSVDGKKVSTSIMTVELGNYFGNKDKGIKCKISSWQRINSLILPPEAKASGNYINSIIASIDAKNAGADEAIMLSNDGYVAEGPGENIFLVEDGVLVTPSRSADILMGITRDTVIKIAENMGIEVEEREVHREELYTCNEVFFSGTAAEMTPIINVDSRTVGKGTPGPIFKILADNYSQIVHGEKLEFKDWLTYVD